MTPRAWRLLVCLATVVTLAVPSVATADLIVVGQISFWNSNEPGAGSGQNTFSIDNFTTELPGEGFPDPFPFTGGVLTLYSTGRSVGFIPDSWVPPTGGIAEPYWFMLATTEAFARADFTGMYRGFPVTGLLRSSTGGELNPFLISNEGGFVGESALLWADIPHDVPVPEPATWLLVATGIGTALRVGRRGPRR